jgi:UDP-3-O-[3-hydroxymyristoyl] glucosamine N-acyltransferase
MKLADVAEKLGCRLEGPPELEIRGVAGIELAEPGQLTFFTNRRYFRLLKTTRASAVLVEEGVTLEREASLPALAALRSASPYAAFARALELFYQPPRYAPGIHPTAIIAKGAKIGESAHIGPYCYVDEESGGMLCFIVSSASIVVCRLAMISSRMRTWWCGNIAALATA